nr:hypothetical transcript [Hymenolepis microstoma]
MNVAWIQVPLSVMSGTIPSVYGVLLHETMQSSLYSQTSWLTLPISAHLGPKREGKPKMTFLVEFKGIVKLNSQRSSFSYLVMKFPGDWTLLALKSNERYGEGRERCLE